jgi:hypothetical protein
MRLHKLITGIGAVLGIMAVSLLRRKAAYIFRGKTVLVTGGSRGFGLLLARAFASRGARVVYWPVTQMSLRVPFSNSKQ